MCVRDKEKVWSLVWEGVKYGGKKLQNTYCH